MTTGDDRFVIPVVVSDDHRLHDPPYELDRGRRVSPVPERAERLDAIARHVLVADRPDRVRVQAREYDDTSLLAVHDPDMVAFLRDGHDAWRAAGGPDVMIADTFRSPAMNRGGRRTASVHGQLGWWCFDTATPLVAGSYRAARAAVDVALTGVDRLSSGDEVVYALTRPPGHHAGYDYFGGFCLFNQAAVAARVLSRDTRVAVLDVDVHHGNGTQDLFWRDPSVVYVSLHGDPDHLFPFFSGFSDERGEGPGAGTTFNIPLARETGTARYLDALDAACEVVTDTGAEVLVVSLGLDTAALDPIGSLALDSDAYRQIGHRLARLDLPTLLIQEGGYAIDHLGTFAADVLDGIADGRTLRPSLRRTAAH